MGVFKKIEAHGLSSGQAKQIQQSPYLPEPVANREQSLSPRFRKKASPLLISIALILLLISW